MEGLQKFDEAVLLVLAQCLEGEASRFRLAVVSLDGLTQRGEQTVMEKWRFVGRTHSLRVRNFALPAKKPGEPAG